MLSHFSFGIGKCCSDPDFFPMIFYFLTNYACSYECFNILIYNFPRNKVLAFFTVVSCIRGTEIATKTLGLNYSVRHTFPCATRNSSLRLQYSWCYQRASWSYVHRKSSSSAYFSFIFISSG